MNGDATVSEDLGAISMHFSGDKGAMDQSPLIHGGRLTSSAFDGENSSENACCFNRCVKSNCCGDKCRIYRVRKASDCLILTFSILAFVALVIAVVAPIAVDGLLNQGVYESFVVDSKDASGYKTFQANTRKGDQEVYYGVYYFDVQNPDAIITGEKPMVIERGPYMYREYFYKFDIEWSKGGELVSFYQWKYFIFDTEKSTPGADLSDEITQAYFTALTLEKVLQPMEPTLQVVMAQQITAYFDEKKNATNSPIEKAKLEAQKQAVLAKFASTEIWAIMYKSLLCLSPYGVSPFMTRSARDVYWGWFNDPIFSIFKPIAAENGVNLTAAIPGIASNYTSMDDARNRKNKDLVYTGKNDIKKINQYKLYQNSSLMWVCLLSEGGSDEEEIWPSCPKFQTVWTDDQAEENGYVLAWDNDWANRIAGTDGVQFGPVMTSDLAQAFISDIYSTRFLGYQSNNEDFHGIPLRRFGLRDKDLENATVVPENAQFYQFGPKGLSNFTQAVGIPLFASKPHFLDGDESLQSAVIGMRPNRDTHDTFLDVEPTTGAVVRARKRLQVSNYLYSTVLPTFTEEDSQLITGIVIRMICKNKPDNCTDPQALTQCLSHTYTWDIANGGLYLPYTWTDEFYDLNHDDAMSIKHDIVDTKTFATDTATWSFVVGGILAGLALAVFVARAVVRRERYQPSEGMSHLLSDGYEAPTPSGSKKYEESINF